MPSIKIVMLSIALLGCLVAEVPAQDTTVMDAFQGKTHREIITSGEDSVRIPFTRRGNLILVDLSVNGHEPIPFILDTGAPLLGIVLFDGPQTEALGLDYVTTVSLGRAGTGDEPNTALGLTVACPGLTLEGLLGIVTESPSTEFNDGGVIGNSFFDRFVVEINEDARELILTRPEAFVHDGEGATIPFTITNARKLLIDVEVGQGGRVFATSTVIDSGAWFGLYFDSSSTPDLPEPERKLEGIIGRSLYGKTQGEICRTDWLQLGEYRLTDIITTKEIGVSTFPENHTIIGNEVLSNFNITYDYSRSEIHFRPCADFNRRREFEMTGLDA